MTPDKLAAWERILQSDVAVALLLLAGLLVIPAILLAWIRTLYAELRQRDREMFEHLKSDADLSKTLTHLQQFIDLVERRTHDRTTEDGLSAVAAGTALSQAGARDAELPHA